MGSRLIAMLVALTASCLCALAQAGGSLLDATAPRPAPSSVLSAEARGDIMMARKMYREALEAFQSEPHKTAVIYNKMGIAYHQLQQLTLARKYYEQALKLKRNYAEAL